MKMRQCFLFFILSTFLLGNCLANADEVASSFNPIYYPDGSYCSTPVSCRLSGYLDLDMGYRWDKLSTCIIEYGTAAAIGVTKRFTKLHSFQFGANALVPILCGFYVRGDAHYGWIHSGRGSIGGALNFTVHGTTLDTSGGLGYLFSGCGWKFGPIGGWSYDEIELHLENPVGAIAAPSQLRSKFSFRGPWMGADLYFIPCRCLGLNFSYELHRAHWKEHFFSLDSAENFSGFTGTSTHKRMWGQIMRARFSYYFCKCWTIGLDLKWQTWQPQGTGHFTRLAPLSTLVFPKRLINDVEWRSFSALAHIGVVF